MVNPKPHPQVQLALDLSDECDFSVQATKILQHISQTREAQSRPYFVGISGGGLLHVEALHSDALTVRPAAVVGGQVILQPKQYLIRDEERIERPAVAVNRMVPAIIASRQFQKTAQQPYDVWLKPAVTNLTPRL